MDCLCHIVCPCFSSGVKDKPESDFDVIPEKGDYFGETNFRGAKHGHGTFCFPNGDMYEGQWKDDKMHGFGEYRFNNGEILNGYFEKGKFVANPPAEVQKQLNPPSNEPRPLTPNSILADKKPIKVKHNEASYSFARTIGNLTQNIGKKGKKTKTKDETDHEQRAPLLGQQNIHNRIDYEATQHSVDPRIAAQIAMERERKQRERREKVQRMKEKYSIRS